VSCVCVGASFVSCVCVLVHMQSLRNEMKNTRQHKFESCIVMKAEREREREREREGTDMRRITCPLFINSLSREEK
jgi:hypothetical protein